MSLQEAFIPVPLKKQIRLSRQAWGRRDLLQRRSDRSRKLRRSLTCCCRSSYTCAIETDGKLRCGDDRNYYSKIHVPVNLGTVSEVAAGSFHVCAIRTDRALRCWGDNDYGQTSIPKNLGLLF